MASPRRGGGWQRSSRRGRRGTRRKAERLAGWEGPELLALNKSWRRKRRGSQGKTMMGEEMERREGVGRGRRVVTEVGARLPLRSP